jgi:type 1 glutamine amidotransferase
MPAIWKRTRTAATLGLLLLALTAIGSVSAQDRPRFKVLVVNVPDVNHATSGDAGLAAIRELGASDGYAVDVCVDYGLFTDGYLAPYDVMVWVMAAPLTWTDTSKAAFEKYVKSGKGWIGLHVAGLTGISKTPWPWFEDYVGGVVFKGHPARQTATVKVDPGALTHPIMKGVSPTFSVFEEWYSWNTSPRTRSGFQVLAGLDETSYNVGNLAMGSDHAFVWTNDQYGRMMYAGFGHEPAIYGDVNVRTMLRNAILWAAETPAKAK